MSVRPSLDKLLQALKFREGLKNLGKSIAFEIRQSKHEIYFVLFLSQVKWAPDNLDGYLNFFSISADGRVTNWTIVKSKLWSNDILEIPFSKPLSNLENVEVNLFDGGQAFAFKPDDDSKFLVGTDLGLVYYCTTEYCSEFLARFRLSPPIRALNFSSQPIRFSAHQAPVYSVEWNTFSPSIFMTCAAEWVIKIWDVASVTNTENPRPLFTFDLGGPVS